MKIYILDDDNSIIRILEQIITEKNIGNIIGMSNNSLRSIKDIHSLEPDIIIMDLLMPELDGISFIEHVRKFNKFVKFIMISQVTSKDMISKAYEKGVTFYINKPINAVEVINVISEVKKYIEAEERLKLINSIMKENKSDVLYELTIKNKVEETLKKIGIVGKTLTGSIVEVIEYLISNYDENKEMTVKNICEVFSDNPKTFEQRIRRTAMIGLENLAYLGIEDNLNENFLEFSNTLYNFKDIKIEMDYIRKETKEHGKVSVKKFIDGLIYYINKK